MSYLLHAELGRNNYENEKKRAKYHEEGAAVRFSPVLEARAGKRPTPAERQYRRSDPPVVGGTRSPPTVRRREAR